jgi:hypothetical protein
MGQFAIEGELSCRMGRNELFDHQPPEQFGQNPPWQDDLRITVGLANCVLATHRKFDALTLQYSLGMSAIMVCAEPFTSAEYDNSAPKAFLSLTDLFNSCFYLDLTGETVFVLRKLRAQSPYPAKPVSLAIAQ